MNNTQIFKSWLKCLKPNPDALVRLFCFPYAGGSSIIFRAWYDSLPGIIEVYSIELPGRGAQIKSTPFTRLEPLVSAIAPILLPYLDKPFAFFGHSMGGLVSFELTRLLRKKYNSQPIRLFISGRRAPQIPDPYPPIHTLPDSEFLLELRRFNGTPVAVLENAELMELLLPTLRADFAVLETYVYTPAPALDCPMTAFGGLQDHIVSYDEIEAWREHTNAAFSLEMFDGDHFFLHSAQSLVLKSISQKLSQHLTK
jgi:medium-chain acyl-[acyl-carrier-protein] hydrolase